MHRRSDLLGQRENGRMGIPGVSRPSKIGGKKWAESDRSTSSWIRWGRPGCCAVLGQPTMKTTALESHTTIGLHRRWRCPVLEMTRKTRGNMSKRIVFWINLKAGREVASVSLLLPLKHHQSTHQTRVTQTYLFNTLFTFCTSFTATAEFSATSTITTTNTTTKTNPINQTKAMAAPHPQMRGFQSTGLRAPNMARAATGPVAR